MHAGQPGTNDAAADITKRRRPVKPVGWGKMLGFELAFSDRLPYLMTTEVSSESPDCLFGAASVP